MNDRPQTADKPLNATSKKEHVAGVALADERGEKASTPLFGGIRLQESITLLKPIEEVYSYWRDFTHFPRFCKNLSRVEVLDDRRSRWTAVGPGDKPLTWEAELIEDLPNQLISWRALPGSEFENAGSVRFKQGPTGRGTEVQLTLTYNPPGGPLGSLIAKLTAKEPAVLLREQLRRFKQLLETGEIPTTDGQPAVLDA